MIKLKIDRDNIKEGGKAIGKISGQNIKDARGRTVARIDGDRIKDSTGRTIGSLSGENLKDSNGRTLIKMNDIRKSVDGTAGGITLAAIWLSFAR